MSIATISPRTALWLTRIRWLAWGALAALAGLHASARLTSPEQPAIMPLDAAAAHSGPACGCAHGAGTI
jgi:hypothetical protein